MLKRIIKQIVNSAGAAAGGVSSIDAWTNAVGAQSNTADAQTKISSKQTKSSNAPAKAVNGISPIDAWINAKTGSFPIDAWVNAAGEIVDINKLPAGTPVWKNGKRYVVRRRRKSRKSRAASEIPVTTWALWGVEQATGTGATALGGQAPKTLADLDKIYRAEMKKALPKVVARMEPLVGVHAEGWQLRAMKTRWGSCTIKTKKIRINVRLAAYPPECLDYVVVHELTHLLEPSHNARFHELVARVIPNEREIRKIMRKQPIE